MVDAEGASELWQRGEPTGEEEEQEPWSAGP